MTHDSSRSNAENKLYVCRWCDVTLTVKLKRLKPIQPEESKFGLVRWELRIGRTRTNWKSFKKRANIRGVDLDVPSTSLRIIRVRLGLE